MTIPVDFQLDVEDAGSLICFIDHFLPMVNVKDDDSKQVALTIFEVRNTIHDALGDMGDEIPRSDSPV
jgi:hypothetical protein